MGSSDSNCIYGILSTQNFEHPVSIEQQLSTKPFLVFSILIDWYWLPCHHNHWRISVAAKTLYHPMLRPTSHRGLVLLTRIINRFSVTGLRLRLHFRPENGKFLISNHIFRPEVGTLWIFPPEVENFSQKIASFSDRQLRIAPRQRLFNLPAGRY